MPWPLLESILCEADPKWDRIKLVMRDSNASGAVAHWAAGRCATYTRDSGGHGIRFLACGTSRRWSGTHGKHVKQRALCERERLEGSSEKERIRDAIVQRHALGLPLNWDAVVRDDRKLFSAAQKWFKRWSKALAFGDSPRHRATTIRTDEVAIGADGHVVVACRLPSPPRSNRVGNSCKSMVVTLHRSTRSKGSVTAPVEGLVPAVHELDRPEDPPEPILGLLCHVGIDNDNLQGLPASRRARAISANCNCAIASKSDIENPTTTARSASHTACIPRVHTTPKPGIWCSCLYAPSPAMPTVLGDAPSGTSWRSRPEIHFCSCSGVWQRHKQQSSSTLPVLFAPRLAFSLSKSRSSFEKDPSGRWATIQSIEPCSLNTAIPLSPSRPVPWFQALPASDSAAFDQRVVVEGQHCILGFDSFRPAAYRR